MPRHYVGPHLVLRRRYGRPTVWVILDLGKEVSTRCSQEDEDGARAALARYKAERVDDGRVPGAEPARPTVVPRAGLIYFVTTRDVPRYPIKVGFTERPADLRVSDLQGAHPYRLHLMGAVPGTTALEAVILRQFKKDRLIGEWLSWSPELIQFIDGILSELSEAA